MRTDSAAEKKPTGIYNYFEGATINNLVINSGSYTKNGAEHHYYKQAAKEDNKKQYSDEQIAKALQGICGKEKSLNNYQLWLGACCLLMDKYNFPRNLESCCERIMQLPYEALELECKYDNIRKFAFLRFVKEGVDTWDTYVPKDEEKKLFYGCKRVAYDLEKALQETEIVE